MKVMKNNLFIFLIFFVLFILRSSVLAEVEYQNRGNRHEGVKPKPVSGYDIELISALVDYKDETKKIPDHFKIKFYLDQDRKVSLTARELDYKYFYWMNKIHPRVPWRKGFDNEFTWPTQDVIRQIGRLEMYDLGIVARLVRPEPARIERVAPVILYHSQFPATIKGYLFTFRANGDARLTCSFYEQGEAKPVFTRIFRRKRGGRSFTVRWVSSTAQEGWYKLVVNGYFLDTNDPIDQTVIFYHKPIVK